MQMDINDLTTVTEVARMYRVDRKTVYNWLSRGVAPANVSICGVHYFVKSKLASFQPPIRGRKPNGNTGPSKG